MKKPINLDTVFLMTSLELITGMVNQLDGLGRNTAKASHYKLITDKERDDVYVKIGKPIQELEKARIELSKELNRRFKEYLGVNKGPQDVDKLVESIVGEHRCLMMTEDQMIKKSEENKPVATLSLVKE